MAPLAPFAIGLMIGISFDRTLAWHPAFYVTIMLVISLLALSAFLRNWLSPFLLLAAGFTLGGAWHWARERVPANNAIERWVRPEGSLLRTRGTVVTKAALGGKPDGLFKRWQYGEDRTSFLLQVENILTKSGPVDANGLLLVIVQEAMLDLAEGDEIEAFGRLTPFSPSPNPGSFDWRGYYRQQGVAARLICDQRENIVRISRQGPGWIAWLKSKTRGLLVDDIAATDWEEASFLEAMVLGHRSKFDRRLNEVFTRAGCIHFIAASGTNIIVLMAALWFFGRLLGLDKRHCAVGMMIAIVLYALVAEARPPILRASVMGLMFCISLLLRRPTSSLNWIFAAAIVLCLIDPMTIYDVGFQLSFAAVLGVGYLAPVLLRATVATYWGFRHQVLRDPYARADRDLREAALRYSPATVAIRFHRAGRKTMYAILVVAVVSLGAWLANLPLTAVWFQRVQPWGVISSVVVYPFMSAIMVLGLLKVAVAVFSPTLAAAITAVLSQLDRIMIRMVEWMADLPYADPPVSARSPWLVILFFALLLLFMFYFPKRRESAHFRQAADSVGPGPERARRTSLVTALLALPLGGIVWASTQHSDRPLRVTVLAVGAGLAVVMEMPDGKTVVYDAGSMGPGDPGRSYLVPYLRHRGINRIHSIYISHPNLDHYDGIPSLLSQIHAERVILNHCFTILSRPNSPARTLLHHLREIDQPIDYLSPHTTKWSFGTVQVEKLWPTDDACSNLSPNEASTVLRVTHAGTSILLTGDIEEAAQRMLMQNANLQTDVLLLPHHGSVCSTTGEFIRKSNANSLIRSSREHTLDTQNGLLELVAGRMYYNTADCGAIIIEVDVSQTTISTWLPCATQWPPPTNDNY